MYKGRYKVSNVCQLLDKSKYPATQTINGVTFTNNGDGTITANGTATTEANFRLSSFRTLAAHKYLLIGSPANGSGATYYLGGNYTRDSGAGFIANGGNASNYVCCVAEGYTANNLIFKPQFFDLTEMFCIGNEPTSVAEFKEKFPDDLYPYSPYCWAKIKSLIYKDDIDYIKMK